MKKKLSSLLILIGFPFLIFAQAQLLNVKGRIVDEKGDPIIGANVIEVGNQMNGTVSDADGNFVIKVREGQSLSISYIGYLSQEVKVTSEVINVILKEDTHSLQELVVIGYQTVKKADLTGAVSVFKPETMKNAVITGTVGEALYSIPGIFVRSGGAPGNEGFIQIRGTSTFGTSNPLYIIDGIDVGTANRDFNYNDIESIQVLKDASAAAIYGSRAANGVIIITTKKGRKGKMNIDFSAKNTFQWLPKYNLTNRDQWITLNDLAFKNAGRQPANHSDGNTNWQNEVFKMGILQDYDLSFSGGGDNNNYYLSTNYQTNSGTTIGADSKRFTARINTSSFRDFGENVRFSIGENLIISNYSVNELNTNPITDVWRMLPTIPIYSDSNPGGYGYGDGTKDVTFGTNPIARENLETTENENFRLRGNAFAEFNFFKTLKYRFNFGLVTSSDSHLYLRKVGNWTYNQPIDPSSLNRNKSMYKNMVYDNTLEFNKTFGINNIAAVAGTSYSTEDYSQIWGTKNNVLTTGDDYFTQLDAALLDPKTGSYQNLAKLFSVFGRINYSYDDKYIVSGTIRSDASSKFGPNYRNGVFPSIAGAWRISKEKFFNVSWIDDLKIRANYGILGSSNIGYWDWVPFINIFPQAIFGADQNINTGMTQVQLVNTDLKWEELHETNVGFDAYLLNRRLEVVGDYFHKTTQDVLTPMQILLTTGNNGGNPMVNAATLKNTGFEVTLNWRDRINNDLNYSVGVNTSYLKNEIVELGYGRQSFTQWDTKSFVGKPIGDWYLIKTDGIFRSANEVLNHVNSKGQVIQPNAQPGDIRYVDFNDDGQITDADRQYCGHSFPAWNMALSGTLEYKGFDLMLQFTSSFGKDFKLFNGPRSGYDRFDDNSNYRVDYDGYDAVTNPDGVDPRPLYADARNARGDQDRWLENGSYLRLKQIGVGYTFPNNVFDNFFTNFRLFVNGQNLLTITKYRGLDPEFLNSNIWDRGYDAAAFPNPYGITFGVQITF
ncbi:MAG TPA: TonB-dependent receptor [Dysgonamonadaceae bacterium]|jgi:TonB-linked SusC/RagA family outer membrane protein|nr:TonB-dependent receptor [Dysgonamonadaceae bacterium]HOV36840.1 TonB-dependent receptor [Dysgonamonadaceae bacterium]HPD43304.1 TonB-dependent receptor [Dysgonamonadaceae bacterium]HRS40886.1 TonB-dependent receptor [Dysgonamonadaceae bacterium]